MPADATDVWKWNAAPVTLRVVCLRAFLFFLFVSTAAAQSDGTALDALKLIARDAAKRLVRIEAREGTPAPERWYLLVHDPAVERGVREFVVADGKLVTSRTLSQFAETLAPADIVGGDSVKIDSAHVAKLAAAFAGANGAKVGSLNYELTRDTVSNGPVWKVTVLDTAGDQLGVLVVNATKGTVLSSEGFEKSPASDLLAPPAGPAGAEKTPGKKTKAPQAATPTPKPNMLKRIFGGGGKSPKSDQ